MVKLTSKAALKILIVLCERVRCEQVADGLVIRLFLSRTDHLNNQIIFEQVVWSNLCEKFYVPNIYIYI